MLVSDTEEMSCQGAAKKETNEYGEREMGRRRFYRVWHRGGRHTEPRNGRSTRGLISIEHSLRRTKQNLLRL